MRGVFLLLVFTIFSTSVSSQSLLRKFIGGVVSGLGEALVDAVTDTGSDEILECKLQQLGARVSDLEDEMKVVNSQISVLNRSVNSLDLRLSDVEDAIPFGAFGLAYSKSNFGDIGYGQLKSIAVIRMMEAELGLNLNASDIGLPKGLELERNKNNLNNVVDHLTFGSEDGPAHVALGRVRTSSFGHSFMFRNYSNNLIYDDQQFGFRAGINHGMVGAELFSSSLSEERLRAGRINGRPLAFLAKNSGFAPLLVEFGLNYITDTYQNGNEIKMTSYDFNIPYFLSGDGSVTALYLYGNYAQINDNGNGYGIGTAVDYNLEGLGIGFWYEYRKLNSSFVSGFFDPFYEYDRFSSVSPSQRRLDSAVSNTNETVLGAELSFNGFNVSGYYIVDGNDASKNYVHLESNIRIPISIGEEDIIVALTGSIDQRNLLDIGEFTIKDAYNNSSNDVIFSMISSVHFPIGESIDLFAKYSNQDFFENTLSLRKVNVSSALFGLQYNWGLDY